MQVAGVRRIETAAQNADAHAAAVAIAWERGVWRRHHDTLNKKAVLF
jgi:hypothetical protein